MKYRSDKCGRVISWEVVNGGWRGDDLELSIDIDLEKKVECLLEKEICKLGSEGGKDMENGLMVVENGKNGEILGIGGKEIDKEGKVKDYDIGKFRAE